MRVLTQASTIGCGHPPGAVDPQAETVLTVAGQGVLTATGISGRSVADCPLTDSNTTTRCRTVVTVSAGAAAKLTVAGRPVLLAEALAGATDGLAGGAPGRLTAVANQTALLAV